MKPIAHVYDGACTGRQAPNVSAAIACYHQILGQYSQRELHRLHFTGFNPDLDSHSSVLSTWKGFCQLEQSLISLVGVHDKRYWLVDYGKNTLEVFRILFEAMGGLRVAFTNTLYQPWRKQIVASRLSNAIDLFPIKISHLIRANEPARLVKEVVDRLLMYQPHVVFLSIVTQGGIRIPVEEIVLAVASEWRRKRLGWPPFFVLDGCQAYGRVDFCLEEPAVAGFSCAFVGCMHKAMRGPKHMGFLLCTSDEWRHRLANVRRQYCSSRDLLSYVRSEGCDPDLPTVDCSSSIGTAAALHGMSAKSVRENFLWTIKWNQYHLTHMLRDSDWKIITPGDSQWASGIVLLQSPPWMDSGHAESIKLLLDPIAIDEFHGLVRVSFDYSHARNQGQLLAAELIDIARKLK